MKKTIQKLIVDEKVVDALICHEITIDSDKGEIKGNPIDLAKKYGFRSFVLALDKYIKLDRVKIKYHKS